MKRLILSAVVTGMFVFGSAYAQETVGAEHYNARQENFRDRIHNGVKNGSLTRAQANRMRAQDRNINHWAANMKAKDGGNLNAAQRQRLHNVMNRQSRHIWNQKH